MERKAYPSDLTDVEWLILEPLIPPPKPGGRPREVCIREVVSAIFYVLRSGCAWRMLPHDFPEREGAKMLLLRALKRGFTRLSLIWADGGYSGKPFFSWVLQHCGWFVEIVKRSDDAEGFVVLPCRWVVERTFGWLMRFRRLSRDYEVLPETSEAMIYAAMVRIMLKRLARNPAVFV